LRHAPSALIASVGANVLMISQASSEQSICFVVPSSTVPQVTYALEHNLADGTGAPRY
jgi:aspartokinase/homoserine dehydrogenase 1